MASLQPFSWDWLPHLTPSQALLLDRLSRWMPRDGEWILPGLEPALGRPLEIRAGKITTQRQRRWDPDCSLFVALEHSESSRQLIAELDAPLAVEMVWLCLTGKVDPSMAAPRQLDRFEQGVLLYLAARTIWAIWGREGPLRVVGLASPRELEQLAPGSVRVHLGVRAGDCQGHAWLHCPAAWWSEVPSPPKPDRRDRWMGLEELPTALHVTLGRSCLALDQWQGARPGDVLVMDEVWARPAGGDGSFSGTLRLHLPAGLPRWRAGLTADGILTVGEPVLSQKEDEVTDQADDQLPTTPDELLEEIPVELSVELGRIPLNAQQALELRPGQPLRLDRRPGDPVDIRLGSKLVARGELVEIEGELGVLLREIFQK